MNITRVKPLRASSAMAPCRLARRREWEIGFHVRHASTDNLQFATVRLSIWSHRIYSRAATPPATISERLIIRTTGKWTPPQCTCLPKVCIMNRLSIKPRDQEPRPSAASHGGIHCICRPECVRHFFPEGSRASHGSPSFSQYPPPKALERSSISRPRRR